MMKLELVAQVVQAFSEGIKIEQLPLGTEEHRRAKRLETAFTTGVHFLRSAFPSPAIQELAKDIWEVFQHRYVVAAIGPPIPTVSFAVFNHQGMVFFPLEWESMIREEPMMQLGAILFVGSQAVDYFNQRFQVEHPRLVTKRARNYEAEYLRVLQLTELNNYQKGLLVEFPTGFDTNLMYTRKLVEPPS